MLQQREIHLNIQLLYMLKSVTTHVTLHNLTGQVGAVA